MRKYVCCFTITGVEFLSQIDTILRLLLKSQSYSFFSHQHSPAQKKHRKEKISFQKRNLPRRLPSKWKVRGRGRERYRQGMSRNRGRPFHIGCHFGSIKGRYSCLEKQFLLSFYRNFADTIFKGRHWFVWGSWHNKNAGIGSKVEIFHACFLHDQRIDTANQYPFTILTYWSPSTSLWVSLSLSQQNEPIVPFEGPSKNAYMQTHGQLKMQLVVLNCRKPAMQ